MSSLCRRWGKQFVEFACWPAAETNFTRSSSRDWRALLIGIRRSEIWWFLNMVINITGLSEGGARISSSEDEPSHRGRETFPSNWGHIYWEEEMKPLLGRVHGSVLQLLFVLLQRNCWFLPPPSTYVFSLFLPPDLNHRYWLTLSII